MRTHLQTLPCMLTSPLSDAILTSCSICAFPSSEHIRAFTHAPPYRYNNKTSYYFDRELETCKEIDFPVGILTPDWLANATYLGTDSVDTHDTHVWTKSEGFIKYWADVKTGLPVNFSPSPFL